MKRSNITRLAMLLLMVVVVVSFVACGGGKPKVTFFWATVRWADGRLPRQRRGGVQQGFDRRAGPDRPREVGRPAEQADHGVAGGTPPDISVVGTRWILDFMSTNSVDEVTQYVSKATVDNINPAAMEAKVKGKLMGLPIAAGARILAINNDLTKAVPKTMEELEADAKKINKPGKVYGLIMPGKSHTELTDFCYYFYAAGGDYFETKR